MSIQMVEDKLPIKSLCLGMAVRQITGSYELTRILNGFGNSVSHSAVLSFDTALASQTLGSNVVIPEWIIPKKFTMMVWDNIDFLEEIPTGGGTTHMANGIIIQHTSDVEHLPTQQTTSTAIKKSVRSLKAPPQELHNYTFLHNFFGIIPSGITTLLPRV